MGNSGCQARRGTLWDSRVTVKEEEATSKGTGETWHAD